MTFYSNWLPNSIPVAKASRIPLQDEQKAGAEQSFPPRKRKRKC